MSLEREFANDGAPGQLGVRDRGERRGPRHAKVDPIHAHPGATLDFKQWITETFDGLWFY